MSSLRPTKELLLPKWLWRLQFLVFVFGIAALVALLGLGSWDIGHWWIIIVPLPLFAFAWYLHRYRNKPSSQALAYITQALQSISEVPVQAQYDIAGFKYRGRNTTFKMPMRGSGSFLYSIVSGGLLCFLIVNPGEENEKQIFFNLPIKLWGRIPSQPSPEGAEEFCALVKKALDKENL